MTMPTPTLHHRFFIGLALLACVCWMLLSNSAHAGCLDQKRLFGVNLAGGEFGHDRMPGVLNKDYVYPSRKDMAYFKTAGAKVIRVPFRWERIQRQANAPLDTAELAHLRRVVSWAQDMDVCVLLDLHNYGSYQGKVVGGAELPAAAFTDVWLKLAQAFTNPDETAFGLMNEPAAVPVAQWMKFAQDAVLALREAGARNLILVGSGRWSGAHEWEKSFDGASAANAFRKFRDPQNNFAIELHQYADSDYSGTHTTCIEPSRLREILERVTLWAKQEQKKLFLGEFGVAPSSECLATLKTILEGMQDTDAWLGWTYWAAGAWWGNYPFSIQPKDGPEASQLGLLRLYLENR